MTKNTPFSVETNLNSNNRKDEEISKRANKTDEKSILQFNECSYTSDQNV